MNPSCQRPFPRQVGSGQGTVRTGGPPAGEPGILPPGLLWPNSAISSTSVRRWQVPIAPSYTVGAYAAPWVTSMLVRESDDATGTGWHDLRRARSGGRTGEAKGDATD